MKKIILIIFLFANLFCNAQFSGGGYSSGGSGQQISQQLNATGTITSWGTTLDYGTTAPTANGVLTIPPCSTNDIGKRITIIRSDATTFTLSTIPTGADIGTISTPAIINSQFGSLTLECTSATTYKQISNIGQTVLAEFGEQVLGSTITIPFTSTNSSTATDIMSFTLPSAGVWEVDYDLRVTTPSQTATSVTGMVALVTDNSNTAIVNSEIVLGRFQSGSTSGSGNNLSASGHGVIRINTTGDATYKLRGHHDGSANGNLAYSVQSDPNGRTKVVWRKISGFTPVTGGGGATKSYTATEALAKGDILEVWNDAGTAKVRKAAQVTNTVGAVFNQTLSNNTANRTAVYCWMENATTFRSMEIVYNSSASIAINSYVGTYNSGTGTFNTMTQVFNNLTLSGAYNLGTAAVYQGSLTDNFNGTGDLLLTIGGTDGIYCWRVSRNGSGLSALLKIGTTNANATWSATVPAANEFFIHAVNNGSNENARVSIASGVPVIQSSGATGSAPYAGIAQMVGNNKSYSFTASGATRWAFGLASNTGYTQNSIFAFFHFAGQPANPIPIVSSSIANQGNFGSSISTLYVDATFVILGITPYTGGTMQLVKFTPTGATTGSFSGFGTFTSSNTGAYRQAIPLTGNRFILLSMPVNSSNLTVETFSINPATAVCVLTNTQNYTVPVSSEKEIITGASSVYDANGTGVMHMASAGDPHFVVGYTNAFIGTVNVTPVGLAKNAIASLATGDVSLNGDIISGLTGLTIGAKYYMNTTTGVLQTGATSVPVGFALSATELQVRINP